MPVSDDGDTAQVARACERACCSAVCSVCSRDRLPAANGFVRLRTVAGGVGGLQKRKLNGYR